MGAISTYLVNRTNQIMSTLLLDRVPDQDERWNVWEYLFRWQVIEGIDLSKTGEELAAELNRMDVFDCGVDPEYAAEYHNNAEYTNL